MKYKSFFTKFLISIIGLTLGFVIVGLYVPVKKLISGEGISPNEFFSFIELKSYIPIIIAVSIALSLIKFRKHVSQE